MKLIEKVMELAKEEEKTELEIIAKMQQEASSEKNAEALIELNAIKNAFINEDE